MKYPKVNKKELSKINKAKFNLYLEKIKAMLQFDNKENEFNLSKNDINLISWNCAFLMIEDGIIKHNFFFDTIRK